MGKLIRMDLYRMNKGKSFLVCLILAFIFAVASTPVEKALYALGNMLEVEGTEVFPETASLTEMIANPISSIGIMLSLLSIVIFFYADLEAGYIKNIAGQMPKKGFSVLSRYIASIVHSLVFLLASLVGNLIGTLPFQRIIADGSVPGAVGTFLLRLLLLESVCAILLLFVTGLRNKSLGMIFAVLLGLPVMTLVYAGINSALNQVFKGVDIMPYMPDQVLKETNPAVLRSILVSAVTIGIFLPLSISIFDRKDVK